MQIHAHSHFCPHHCKLLGGHLRDWVSLGALTQLEQIPFRCYKQWFEGGLCAACQLSVRWLKHVGSFINAAYGKLAETCGSSEKVKRYSSGELSCLKGWHLSTFDDLRFSAWMVFRLLLRLNCFASSPQSSSSTSSYSKWSNIQIHLKFGCSAVGTIKLNLCQWQRVDLSQLISSSQGFASSVELQGRLDFLHSLNYFLNLSSGFCSQ